MGRPAVHFEIMGEDTAKTWPFYTEMFGWGIDGENPMHYGLVDREANVSKDGVGIGLFSDPEGNIVGVIKEV